MAVRQITWVAATALAAAALALVLLTVAFGMMWWLPGSNRDGARRIVVAAEYHLVSHVRVVAGSRVADRQLLARNVCVRRMGRISDGMLEIYSGPPGAASAVEHELQALLGLNETTKGQGPVTMLESRMISGMNGISDARLVPEFAPSPGPRVVWVREPVIWVRMFSIGNPGHAIIDNSVPVHRAVRTAYGAGVAQHGNFTLFFDRYCSHSVEMFDYSSALCRKFAQDYVQSLSRQGRLFLGEESLASADLVCFDSITLGLGLYSAYGERGWFDAGGALASYRDDFYSLHDISLPHLAAASEGPIVLLQRKVGRRTFVSYEELIDRVRRVILERNLPVKLVVVDFGSLSLREILMLNSRTLVYITPPGASACNVLLLPPGATMVTSYYVSEDGALLEFEASYIYQYAPGVVTKFLPIDPILCLNRSLDRSNPSIFLHEASLLALERYIDEAVSMHHARDSAGFT